MKTIGIIAEFNPFHNGHKYLIEKCKKDLNADHCVVVMSGDFVQRGAPAIIDKFERSKMALCCGADLILELPVYYSLGSAEYFAQGAVSLLNSLGVIDYLCFGSEFPDIDTLDLIADILVKEPDEFKNTLNENLKAGDSYPTARTKALKHLLFLNSDVCSAYDDILSSPNSILGIEYLKALKTTGSLIKPYSIKREGAGYHCDDITTVPSAQGIRNALFACKNDSASSIYPALKDLIPSEALSYFTDYNGKYIDSNDFSELLYYKLLSEKDYDFTKYLDVTEDFSNRIISYIDEYKDFNSFCELLKTKNMTYTRISRCLMHILLNITKENMILYKTDDFTSYIRILGMLKESSTLLANIKKNCSTPIINRLKDAEKILSPLQMKLLNETLSCSRIYNLKAQNDIISEYRLKQLIL